MRRSQMESPICAGKHQYIQFVDIHAVERDKEDLRKPL